MRLLLVTILVFFTCATTAWGARNITLPHSEDFTDSDSIDDIAWVTSGNGASVTRVQGSWRGASDYVVRIDPPTIVVSGGGINGGAAALGAFHFTATNTFNVAFALNVGTTYSSSAANAGGSLINKFIDIYGPSDRAGLLGLNNRGPCDQHEFGLMEATYDVYWYKGVSTTPTIDANCNGVYFYDGDDGPGDLAGQWIWLNYSVNHSTGDAILRIWDRDGNYSGTHFQIPDATNQSIDEVRMIGGYYNEYHPTADTNSRLLIDDITISSNTGSIDPPSGFITSGEPSRSAGSPSGELAAGTTSTTLSLSTAAAATCKYGTVSGTAYASIANTFSTTGGTSHSQSLTGLTNGSNYNYYVRCIGGDEVANTSDYTVSFSVALQAVGGGGTGRAPYSATARVPYSATKFARYYEVNP